MEKVHHNSANLTGRLVEGPTLSRSTDRTTYYKGLLAVERLSNTIDYLPIVVPDRVIEGHPDLYGKLISVTGQISTTNKPVDGKSRLLVDLFAYHIDILEDGEHVNDVELRGVVCKAPGFRITPRGRELGEFMLAVNRPGGRSSYIPCIAWGSDARTVRNLHVGDMLELRGRFQSREYDKILEDGTSVHRIAYEVSASKVVTEAD